MSESSTSSLHPSRSQSVELLGSSKFCVEPQLAAPPRGQLSGELSVIPSLSSSESQASPCASPSVLPWRGFESLGQLSEISGTPSLSLSDFIDGSRAQTKLSHPPVLVTLLPPLVMVAGGGPANEPTTAAMSLEFKARSQPNSREVLAVTSNHDQSPLLVRPPINASASMLAQLLLVGVAPLVPPVKLELAKKVVKMISPCEVTSIPWRLSAALLPPIAAHWFVEVEPSLMKKRSAPPLLAVMDHPFLLIVPSNDPPT